MNTLTALLIAHGVRHAVVCPGSRNSALVHNLNEAPAMRCYPVTDERSAAFFALGISLQTQEPVVVCVTSGTALLNVLPAVAEARYQHVPLIVVSADRPRAWIDQLDGQTLPQPDALGRFVGRAVTLPEGDSDEDRWLTNRLVNEALLDCRARGGQPVHINVPLHEPLYNYNVSALPEERVIHRMAPTLDAAAVAPLLERLCRSPRLLVVIGQLSPTAFDVLSAADFAVLRSHCIVVGEALQPFPAVLSPQDYLSAVGECPQRSQPPERPQSPQRPQSPECPQSSQPTALIYLGGCLVSKELKAYLRRCTPDLVVRVSDDGDVADTFCHLTDVVVGRPGEFMKMLGNSLSPALRACPSPMGEGKISPQANSIPSASQTPSVSQVPSAALAMQLLEQELAHSALGKSSHITPLPKGGGVGGEAVEASLHLANSTSIRLACRYLHHYVYCNRGVNGIEGSLSTAAGQAAATDQRVICVIGDLSFFYDQNALWNQNNRGNLRVLLLNDHGGGIFSRFKGLKESAARERLVMAAHPATAEGICQENHCIYLQALTAQELQQGIHALLTAPSDRPMVLEVALPDSAGEGRR